MADKPLFITFEGIDGAGKDTQLHKLAELIREGKPFGSKYANIWITREPTKMTKAGTTISHLIRLRQVSAEEATQHYIDDRKEHTECIRKILKHSYVLCSRYDLSTLSYQMTQGADFENLYKKHEFGKEKGCIIPDVTLVFDVPVSVALDRIGKRGDVREIFEKEEFLTKLKENQDYCITELRKRGRVIVVVNADQTPENVTKEMITKLAEL
jgi:dTMP kinase